jgi:hypothetical protein
MHMVKEFRAFGGEAPSGLMESCGDHQPWSIGAPLSVNAVGSKDLKRSRGR